MKPWLHLALLALGLFLMHASSEMRSSKLVKVNLVSCDLIVLSTTLEYLMLVRPVRDPYQLLPPP